MVKPAEVAGALSGGSSCCWLSVVVGCLRASRRAHFGFFWGVQGGGSVRNLRGTDEDDYFCSDGAYS